MKHKEKGEAQRSPERMAILEKIRALEAAGGDSFYVDVEDDPSGHG